MVEAVLARVLQHVDERVADFGRRAEDPCMVVVLDERPRAPPCPVQTASRAHEKALHPPGERPLVVRFDDHVHVVRLYGVVTDAEAEAH